MGSYVWTALRPWNDLVQSAAARWPNQHTKPDDYYCSPFGLYVHFGIALVTVSAVLHVSALLGCVGSFKVMLKLYHFWNPALFTRKWEATTKYNARHLP